MKCNRQTKTLKAMLELRRRYYELKQKAKELMLEGKTNKYIELLTEVEQLNLLIVNTSK